MADLLKPLYDPLLPPTPVLLAIWLCCYNLLIMNLKPPHWCAHSLERCCRPSSTTEFHPILSSIPPLLWFPPPLVHPPTPYLQHPPHHLQFYRDAASPAFASSCLNAPTNRCFQGRTETVASLRRINCPTSSKVTIYTNVGICCII